MFVGIVKLNVALAVFPIAIFVMISSSLNLRFALNAITKTRSSSTFPKFIISTVYSVFDPAVMSVGPFIFFIKIDLFSPSISISTSLFGLLAFCSVQMLSLFVAYSFPYKK